MYNKIQHEYIKPRPVDLPKEIYKLRMKNANRDKALSLHKTKSQFDQRSLSQSSQNDQGPRMVVHLRNRVQRRRCDADDTAAAIANLIASHNENKSQNNSYIATFNHAGKKSRMQDQNNDSGLEISNIEKPESKNQKLNVSVESDGNNSRQDMELRYQHRKQSEELPTQLCFEVDFSFLDNCTPDNQLIRNALTDDFWNQQIDFENFIEENIGYLLHYFAQCACAKCTCRQCVCLYILNSKTPQHHAQFQSAYSKFYQGQKASSIHKLNHTDPMNLRHRSNLSMLPAPHAAPEEITGNSTYQRHFQQISSQPQPRFQKKGQIKYCTFLPKSTAYQVKINIYKQKTHYPNWKDYDPTWVFKHPVHKYIASENPSSSPESAYQNQFKNQPNFIKPNENASDVKQIQNQQNMPFSRAYPTIIDSSYVTHYSKNMKVETPKRKYKFKSELETYYPTQSFLGQYSTESEEFKQHQNKAPQVDKKAWKKKLQKQLIHLHEQNQLKSKGQNLNSQ